MNTRKIVLALALAAVTPAVLAAQENGNAYNQSTNEVIVSKNTATQASILDFGPESKVMSLADRTLAKIKARREARNNTKPQVEKVNTDTTTNPHNAYYVYAGSEGKMMIHSDLSKNTASKKQDSTNVPTYVKEADTLSNNHQVVLSPKAAEKSAKTTNKNFRYYVRLVAESLRQDAPYEK